MKIHFVVLEKIVDGKNVDITGKLWWPYDETAFNPYFMVVCGTKGRAE